MVHQGHRSRLKKRFLQEGLSSFEPHEVLELLLFYTIPQKDVNPIAHGLLNTFGSLEGVFSASKNALLTVDGIGEQSALYLMLFLPLLDYYQQGKFGEQPVFNNRKKLFDFCLSLLAHKKEEHFYLLSLDGSMGLLQTIPLTKGSSNQISLTVRRIVEVALQTGAHSIVLCHNHPGGTLSPSKEDIESTLTIKEVLKAIDVILIDHIIVAKNKSFSIFSSLEA